ncbi:MAG: hypothetical protein ACLTAI_07280 [Thomasclavelia sp.]
MKLGKCATALVVTSFLLTGCSNSNTVKEDGKYVVASLSKGKSDKNIFADDIFADITNTNRGKSAYFEAILQKLMDDRFPTDKDMEIDASRTVEQIQTYYEAQYGDQAEDQIKTVLASSGYSTLDEYEKAMVQAYQKSNFLLDYVKIILMKFLTIIILMLLHVLLALLRFLLLIQKIQLKKKLQKLNKSLPH